MLSATDLAAHRIDPRGITLISITPDQGATFTTAQRLGSRALTTFSWVCVCLLVGKATDRLSLPRTVKAVATGAAVYALDSVSARMAADMQRAAEQAKVAQSM